MDDKGPFYEQAKKGFIYPKYFPRGKCLGEDEFRKAVLDAYGDIVLLITEMGGHGNGDEDYYMAEWLCENRSGEIPVSTSSIEDLASRIYQIRERRY